MFEISDLMQQALILTALEENPQGLNTEEIMSFIADYIAREYRIEKNLKKIANELDTEK